MKSNSSTVLESIHYNFVQKIRQHNAFHVTTSHLCLKFPTLSAALADDGCQSKQNNNSGKFQTQMTSDMESIM